MADEYIIELLRRESANTHDRHAVAVYQDNVTVGHVPYNLAPAFWREVNKGFATVTGEKINRGAGNTIVYITSMDQKLYIDKMKELVDSLNAAGLM